MKKISKISRIKRIENDLREQEKGKEKNKNNADFDSMLKEERKLEETQNKRKKPNSLDAYRFEIQRSIVAQKKISQIYNEEKEQEEK